jgi:hypothetical protein
MRVGKSQTLTTIDASLFFIGFILCILIRVQFGLQQI